MIILMERNIIGKQIKSIRQSKNITQAQLAARLNIQEIDMDQTMISKIEDQVRGVQDFEIKAIAKALNISIEDLFK